MKNAPKISRFALAAVMVAGLSVVSQSAVAQTAFGAPVSADTFQRVSNPDRQFIGGFTGDVDRNPFDAAINGK